MSLAPPIEAEALRARRTSPWTTKQKLGRSLWYVTEATLFRWSPRPCYRWRNFLLRLFGARVHRTARIRPTVTTEVPWNLEIGPDTIIGDRVILYCLGPMRIGARVMISQLCHLCGGTHDHRRMDLPLVKASIFVNDDVWLAADVFVGPGASIGAGTVVGARSSVFGDLPGWTVCVGNPARPIKPRVLK